VAPLTCQVLHVILMAIECLGHVGVCAVAPHHVEAPHPDATGLMMARNDRVGHIVDASTTGCAQRALTRGRGLIMTWFGHLSGLTRGTTDAGWPA